MHTPLSPLLLLLLSLTCALASIIPRTETEYLGMNIVRRPLPDGTPRTDEQVPQAICPVFTVNCVKDKDWRHPVGDIGKKPFCREGIRCNQCDEARNTHECNRLYRQECTGECEAYGPIPF